MTGFALMATIMLAGAMLFLLPPLLKKRGAAGSAAQAGSNLALYRDQLAELEADVRNGTLSDEQFEESRSELERSLLDELAGAAPGTRAASGGAGWTALAVGFCVPLLALLLYWRLGTPQAILLQSAAGANPHPMAHADGPDQLDLVTERLALRLQASPDDAAGWALLGRSYAVLGRHGEAVSALRRADELAPGDGQLLADLADALAMTQGGRLAGEPMRFVQRALEAEAGNAKALALAGTEAFDRHNYRSAARYWTDAVAAAPPGSEFAASLEASLAEARSLGGIRSPATVPAGETASSAGVSVSGRVTLATSVAASASPDDTLLLFARAERGPRMPLALLRARVRDLPLDFVLDDTSAMMPGLKLSSADRVMVIARISKSGAAEARSGDLQGMAGPVPVGTSSLQVEIGQMLR